MGIEESAQEVINGFTRQLMEAIEEAYAYLESRPVYTISELLAPPDIRPRVLIGLGGPAEVFIPLAAQAMGIGWEVLPYHEEANAIGAAASRPTAARKPARSSRTSFCRSG